ncbi:BatD family protein [Flaviramulus sp. BrNp1-15]|uniref:BatD family protein n=1 Tax=Flaviramulus sp. BrNp1-15 TaxID=2916754 RepID=UPI001EE8475F|nr:BatD family protein [Flaviramulus sp. BrNp1-15]ULC59595.1 BatD family protein [Flaviramulus sp. BrNp1-15]
MKKEILKINRTITSSFRLQASGFISFVFCLLSFVSFAQVTSSIDSTSIKIGEQITYNIQVETDTTSLVVFPEGQTFSPLEMIESYEIDTTKNNDRYNLVKKYGLTQFDSGAYTIPRQKIIIGDKTFFTDSLKVEVNNVVIDTTKQGLYDIKPIISVKKSGSNWWKYLLITLLIIGALAFLMYWFIWRKKPLTEEEQIALLPPYDRAKLALKKLDESHYLENENLKDYYSDLTFIIRKYLDEKVYDRALESTTDELINRLNLLKEGNQVDISKEDIKNLESILKRADLVKFAKSAPDIELAKIDRNTIDIEIDHVKEALPEPTEEEKLLDQQYREEQERKKKRKKVWITIGISLFLLLATITGLSIKYGFDFVKDTIIGHDSKELLEGDWVNSEYGFPPVSISTPKVLKRFDLPIPDELKASMNMTTFMYGTLLDEFSVAVSTASYKQAPKDGIDLEKSIEGSLKGIEAQGAKDIVTLTDKFTTPNGAEGVKTYGTLKVDILETGNFVEVNYILLHFTSENVLQQIVITYPKDDSYADQTVERILNSIELKKDDV